MSTSFNEFNPDIHSVFRVDGPMFSGKSLKEQPLDDAPYGHPSGTKAAYVGHGTMCCAYFAPTEIVKTMMIPYSDQEVFDFLETDNPYLRRQLGL